MSSAADPAGQVAETVLASPKYRQVMPAFVGRLARQELGRGRSVREAVKAVKSKLHQVGAAYTSTAPDYGAWTARLDAADADAHPDELRKLCREMMAAHASTRERLPILEQAYCQTLEDLAPIHSVLDLACGLNPLAAPWMPLAPGAAYHACDIYLDQVAFLSRFFQAAGLAGQAFACDLTTGVPEIQAEVVFLMKALPCLEQVDRRIGILLLDSLPGKHALLSFPAQSLGGRRRGMEVNYPAHLEALVAGRGWQVRRFDFPGEIFFRLDRAG